MTNGPLEEPLQVRRTVREVHEAWGRSPFDPSDVVLVEQELPPDYREAWVDFLGRIPRREWRKGWVGAAPDGSTRLRFWRKRRRGSSHLRRIRYLAVGLRLGERTWLKITYTEDGRFGNDLSLGTYEQFVQMLVNRLPA